MSSPETFIYVGGSLGLVGGHDANPRLTFVRLSDYDELDKKMKRMALDSISDIGQIAELQAEVRTLTDSITRGASVPDAIPLDELIALKAEVERLKEENEVLQNRCDFLEGRNKE
jgi:hypothetical protein